MKSKLKVVGAFILFTYCTLLVFAGWSAEVRPAFFDTLSDTAWELLRPIGVQPGVAVFFGDKERQRLIADCISVSVATNNGQMNEVYSYENCKPPKIVRLHIRGLDLLVSHYLGDAYDFHILRETDDDSVEILSKLFTFFCRAPADQAQLTWDATYENFDSQRRQVVHKINAYWDCKENRPKKIEWAEEKRPRST